MAPETLSAHDAALIVTDHSAYDYESIVKHSNLVVDTRNALKANDKKRVLMLVKTAEGQRFIALPTAHALEVKAGDKILFSKYSGTEVKIDGEEHLILREDDILGIVT